MNKRLLSTFLLFSFSLSFIPHNADAIRRARTRQRQNQQNQKPEIKKPTIEQSLGKFFTLKWSKLTKDDAKNLAHLGLTVGGIYLLFRYSEVLESIFDYRNISSDYMHELGSGNTRGEQRTEEWLNQEEKQETSCATCLGDFHITNRYLLACGHNDNCGECLQNLIRVRASEGNITDIRCPHRDIPTNRNGHATGDGAQCNHIITPQEMINIANGDPRILADARQAIQNGPRNHALQTVPNLRACHLCPTLFVYRGRRVIKCPGCQEVYCAHCRGNHNGNLRNCVTRNQNIIKMCPRCGSDIARRGGCNHMACTQCRYNFCWVCLGPFGGRDGVCRAYHCTVRDRLFRQGHR